MKKQGHIHLIVGPMFAGKSDELISEYNAKISSKELGLTQDNLLVVKPLLDSRDNQIKSRTGKELEAAKVSTALDIKALLNENIKELFIDEFQFFKKDVADLVKELKKDGLSITLAGLDHDFRKMHFSRYKDLIDDADKLTHLLATCHTCGQVAKYSRKEINGKPAGKKSNTIEIELKDGAVQYFAACSKCYK